MKTIFLPALVILPLLLCPSRVNATFEWLQGNEPGLWTDRQFCLIVAKVTEIHELKGAFLNWRIQIDPVASLAGTFDASAAPNVVADLQVGNPSSIYEAPKQGDLVLVVIEMNGDLGANQKGPRISSAGCDFMSNGGALVVLKDMEDPRIEQTLQKLRKVRKIPSTQAAQ